MEMSPSQWDRVKQLYEAALECSPTERSALLQRNEDDEVVRQEVRRLLNEGDTLDSFLSTPAFVDPRLGHVQSTERYSTGTMVAGRFQIVKFICGWRHGGGI